MDIQFNQIKSFYDGKAGLICGLSQQIGLPRIIDNHLEKHTGRPAEIPYGSLAQLMLINISDDHHPLSRLMTYFENVDIESLLGHEIDLKKLNDDRFGGFLDAMHDAGCHKIYAELAANAFSRYGIALKNVNFDTTSKVMWGAYETSEGVEGAVDITFGYSKQKRPDKRQIKISLGTTQGICIDGQILSGNISDKSFNVDALSRAHQLKQDFGVNEDFFYIADSAAFSKDVFNRAKSLDIDVITRMPDNITFAKEAYTKALDNFHKLELLEIPTSTTPSMYHIYETECVYDSTPLKMAVCYSEKLKTQKENTVKKRVVKESIELSKLENKLKKRIFACESDAIIEIQNLSDKDLKKLKYHDVNMQVEMHQKRSSGRPCKDFTKNDIKTTYSVLMSYTQDELRIKTHLDKECMFIVVCTNMALSASQILSEYKSQSAVERKFQFLKSPQFVNAMYLDSPKRIESLGYLMLILMLLLSVAEFVVRRELKRDETTIIGPGNKIMARPSLMAIYRIFYSVVTSTVTIGGVMHRGLNQPLRENVKTIMKYLGIPENIYFRGAF